jgi:hypothetical protein
MYINSDIPFVDISFDVTFPNEVEVNCVKIFPPHQKPVVYVSIYKPPHINNEDFISSFDSLLFHLTKEPKYIISGDLNINTLDVDDKSSKNLASITSRYSLQQLITSPTRTTYHSATLIDHIYVPQHNQVIQSGNFSLTHSDHDCIYAVEHYIRQKYKPKIIHFRKFKNINWDEIKLNIKLHNWKTTINETDADSIFHDFHHDLNSFIDTYAPLCKKRVKGTPNPWLTSELIEAFHQRDILKNQAKSTQDPQLWIKYKKIRNLCTTAVRLAKKKYFVNKFQAAKNSTSIWKTYSELMGKKNTTTTK